MTNAEDPYAGFAEHYDRFYGDFSQHRADKLRFFADLFGGRGVRRVLDCACGTGHDLHLLHGLGFEVVGSDVSTAMLARARRNLEEQEVEVPLNHLDYRHLPECFGAEFDAVVCLASSLLHMPDAGEVLRALESMRRVLRPGGVLVLSQGTTDRQWAQRPRFILAADTADYTRLFVIDYRDRGATYHVVDVRRDEEAPVLESWAFDYPEMLLGEDYRRLLPAAGLREVTLLGSYTGEPYDPKHSDLLIVVGEAPA